MEKLIIVEKLSSASDLLTFNLSFFNGI